MDSLGSCCACGKPDDGSVRNVLCLAFEAPKGFNGWGCFVCGIPSKGAIAVKT